MRGSITKRKLKSTSKGKPINQYYIVYDLPLSWDEDKECYRRRQKWEKVENPKVPWKFHNRGYFSASKGRFELPKSIVNHC